MKSLILKQIAVLILGGSVLATGAHCTTESDVVDPTFKEYFSLIGQVSLINSLSGVCGVGNTSLDLQASTTEYTVSTTAQTITYAADTTGNHMATILVGTTASGDVLNLTGSNFSATTHYPLLSTDTTCPYQLITTSADGVTTDYTSTSAITMTFTFAGNFSILMYCPSSTCSSAPTNTTVVKQ